MKRLLWLLILPILIGCDLQRKMLYYPGQFQFQDIKQAAATNELVLWPVDSPSYLGIMTSRRQFSYKGTVIVFHGNAGPAICRVYYVNALERLGYRVILAEYPGYGGKYGKMTEENLVYEGKKVIASAIKDFGGPIYIWGESMGCGIAAAIVSDDTIDIKGVVMLTPWDNLINVAKRDVPALSSSAGLLVKDKYDSVRNISKYNGSVAVVMAENDEIIPNDLTLNLYKSINSRKKLFILKNSGHNNWPNGPELTWWSEVMTFIEEIQ